MSAEPFPPLLTGGGWRDQAACRDADPRLFDYDPETDSDSTAAPARRICADCRVQTACLRYALSQPAEDDCNGIYGGLTPAERSERRAREAGQRFPAGRGRGGRPTKPRGWVREFMADRALAEQAFQLAREQSILAAASAFQVSAPTLRRAFAHHGLGHPHAGLDRAELQRRWSTRARAEPDHHHRRQRRTYRARLAAERRAL